jgi:transposase
VRCLARRSVLGQGSEAPPKPYVGNRDANRSLHLICVVRMRVDERTRRYVARRSAEGKSKQEIMRCLKRYIAREVYRVLVQAASPSPNG